MSDLLNDVLSVIGDHDIAASPPEPDNQMMIAKSIEFVQAKSTRHTNSKGVPLAGMIYIGPIDDVSKGVYVEKFDFLLVGSVVFTLPRLDNPNRYEDVGGRRMRGYSAAMPNAPLVRDMNMPDSCRSTNGIVPVEAYIGKQVVDPRTMKPHIIGTDAEGNLVTQTVRVNGFDLPDICRRCPLSQWHGNLRPPCESVRRYVVFILPNEQFPRGELATIRGENTGVDNALRGAAAGSSAAAQDGRGLIGIRQPFMRRSETVQKVVKAADVGSRARFVVGGCKDEKLNGFEQAFDPEKHPYAVMQFPTYAFAPEGRPEEVGEFTKVYAVSMGVTPNAYKVNGRPTPTFVPDIAITNKLVDEATYTAYLEALYKYYEHKMNDVLARMTPTVVQKTLEAVVNALPAPTPRQTLPPTTEDPNSGIVF
jgi:hypothetical protein